MRRSISIVVFLLSFLSAHAQTNSQNDFLTIREAMDIVSYRRYHPLTDGDMDDLIKFTAKKYGYIEEDFLEGVGTCSFWQYIKNGYVVYDTAAEDFFVPYNKQTASAVAIVDCQGIETIDYDEVAISAELRVFSEHSRDILLSEMKDIGFRLMNSEDRFLTYVWQDYTICFQKFVTRGHDCWEFDVRLNYHKYNTTKHVEFRDSTRTRNLKFSLDYPVKGNPILLKRIRTLMMEAIEPDLVYEEPMPRYSGNMSDGQALVNYYGRKRCKMLDTEEYGSPATEITSVKVVGENDYYISFEVYRYSDYGASSNFRVYGATFRKNDGKRLQIIANPKDPKYKEFLNENLYFDNLEERDDLFEEYREKRPLPEYEPYLIQNGVRFVYQQGEIAVRPAGFLRADETFSVIRDFLIDEVKDVLKNQMINTQICPIATTPVVGTLTVLYAKEEIRDENHGCKKGELYYDSNDYEVSFREDDDNFIFERWVDDYDGDGIDTWSIPKSKLEKKTYKMYQLSAQDIGSKAVFISENGSTARIFWSNINGHYFCSWDGQEVEWDYTNRYDECYVLSVEYNSERDGVISWFEEPLDESHGFIRLYRKHNRFDQEVQIGRLEESWINKEGWGDNRSAYSEDGKLLTDQWGIPGIPNELSIAYLAEENALYIDGVLYYRR